jgi:hypothetical protein
LQQKGSSLVDFFFLSVLLPKAKKDCQMTCDTKGKSLSLKTWGFLCRRAGPNPWGYRDVFGPDAFSFHPHGLM